MSLLGPDLHILTGVYALDAVQDGTELDRFTRHLDRCQACSAEVRGLREVATSLALAAALPPPPDLRGRVMAAAARTRQLPPASSHHARSAPGRAWVPRLAAAAAAAGIAAAAAAGITQLHTQRQLSQAQDQEQAIAAVLSAPDARLLIQPTAAGGTATVVISQARRELIVSTTGLPALPAARVYELWLIGPRTTRPAGLLPAALNGSTRPLIAAGLAPDDKLAMTVEPAGGTSRPTTAPILVMSLRA